MPSGFCAVVTYCYCAIACYDSSAIVRRIVEAVYLCSDRIKVVDFAKCVPVARKVLRYFRETHAFMFIKVLL